MSEKQKTYVDHKRPQIKKQVSSNSQKVWVRKDMYEEIESKTGSKVILIKFGENEKVIISPRFIFGKNEETGNIRVSIKKNFEFPIYKTDYSVLGKDLINHIFEMMKWYDDIKK